PAIGVAVAAAYGDAAHLRAAALLTAAHGLFQCIALPFGGVFRVDAGNVYHRGPLFPVYAAALVLSILYGCVAALRGGRAYQTGMDSVLLLTLLMLTAGVGLLLVFPDIRIAYLCVSVGNTLLYMRHYKIMLQVDAVTGLLNRRCYDVNMADLGSQAVILLFDVDQFKQVNDTFGHSVGDICLQQVAGILRSIYGRYGLCYRIGGDEFAVIMRSGLGRTEILNRGFDSLIRKLREADGRMPGVSMGYARYDAAASRIQDVLEEADAMLYRRKSEKARVSGS
ncbi:MAG: GGDEF domain-containing protein, partial [Oscillospiraceae bacterium]|nr:GGDEF domain-containing protein [Oscillospiraceae bacterium]